MLESRAAEIGGDDPQQLTLYVTGEAETTVDVPCVPGMLSDADRLIEGGFEDRSAVHRVILSYQRVRQ